MKKFFALLFTAFVAATALGQKYVPQINTGSIIGYAIVATATGMNISLTLKVISLDDPMKFKWDLPGLGSGNFLIPAKALENGTKMRLKEPNPDEDTKFKDDESVMFISKASLTSLLTNQSFTLNKITFTAKPLTIPYQINGKEADVIHAVSANGKVEIWILNNPALPLICKLTGNPAGIDFDLTTLKE